MYFQRLQAPKRPKAQALSQSQNNSSLYTPIPPKLPKQWPLFKNEGSVGSVSDSLEKVDVGVPLIWCLDLLGLSKAPHNWRDCRFWKPHCEDTEHGPGSKSKVGLDCVILTLRVQIPNHKVFTQNHNYGS